LSLRLVILATRLLLSRPDQSQMPEIVLVTNGSGPEPITAHGKSVMGATAANAGCFTTVLLRQTCDRQLGGPQTGGTPRPASPPALGNSSGLARAMFTLVSAGWGRGLASSITKSTVGP